VARGPLLAPVDPNFTISNDTCVGRVTAKGTATAKCVVMVEFTPTSGTPKGPVAPVSLSYDFMYGANPPVNVTVTLKGKVK